MNISKRMGRILFHLIFFAGCETFFILAFSSLLIYYGPFMNVRDYVVSTAMGTSGNHFFATLFLDSNKINSITSKNELILEKAVEDPNQVMIPDKADKSIEIVDIKEDHFIGKLILVKDPGRIRLGLAPKLGHTGALLRVIVKDNNAVGGINLLSGTFDLYYQNEEGILFCNSQKVNGFENEKVNLLGRDSNDNIYVQPLAQKGMVYVVSGSKIIKTIRLDDTGFLKLQYGRTGIYAVYDSYIRNLTDNTNRKILYDSNYSFLDLVNDRIYLKDKNNDIVSSKVK